MSANNEAEPAAAMAAAAPSAAASAASASEYLKRTCLICGCQTNQTINIYEPRSGPNIVQLIQAKFKFQPLNEDKFLCFSCNNWLINWHSLQALNSNDAESPSRSQSPSHLGNNSSAGALVQQQQPKDQPLKAAKLRPVAQVHPQPQPQQQQQQQQAHIQRPSSPPAAQSAPAMSYNKRGFTASSGAAGSGAMRKMLRHCSSCSAPMVLRLLSLKPAQTLAKLATRRSNSQCRRCRESEISKWRRMHRRSLRKVAQLQRELSKQILAKDQQQQQQQAAKLVNYQRLPAPRVDGKVVAMFRRLGTTLSSEQATAPETDAEVEVEKPTTVRPLRIMSPAKQRPRWTRNLDEDEILLEFDSVITEVLPAPAARRRLRYQLTSSSNSSSEQQQAATEAEADVVRKHKAVTHHTAATATEATLSGLQLPQGLSITLI
ncbi:protein phyllopod [Drosophila grimshawi]|uniref:GH22992 n=1 Tax=Drosophila grimshawi TaxID=7222 RepID=B4JW92_DROGR|nr:protein phyllopod [Drosophila grimshawi]EDV98230.1 GH22992 [Drosophila grimshawi]